MGAAVMSWVLTHLKSFSPLCWIMWRLRWDLREKRRPQPSTGHWQGRCGHRDIAVRLHTRQPTLLNITLSIFHWMWLTAPVCTVSWSLSLHCLLKVAPQLLWLQLKSCNRGPPTPLLLPRTPFIVVVRELFFLLLLLLLLLPTVLRPYGEKGAARVCPSYRLLAGLNWLIGGDTVSGWQWWSWLSSCSAQVWQPTFAGPNKSGHVGRWERRQEKRCVGVWANTTKQDFRFK